MKKLTLCLLVVLSGCSPKTASTFTTKPNRVLYASTDINRISSADSIAQIKSGGFLLGKNLTITLRNGERRTISKKNVWGYSDKKGNVWRRFRSSYYQVLRVGDVVEYEIIEPQTVGPSMVINEPVKKYSKTLDSKIVGSRKQALRISDERKAK